MTPHAPSLLALTVRAREAVEDGDVDLVRGILEELEQRLVAEGNRWVTIADGSLIADMSVFDEDELGR